MRKNESSEIISTTRIKCEMTPEIEKETLRIIESRGNKLIKNHDKKESKTSPLVILAGMSFKIMLQ